MKKYLTEKFWKGLGKYFYDSIIYPALKEYVEKTDNKYDDRFLVFVDDAVDDFLAEKKD